MRRRIAIYFSWNRAAEEAARLGVLENRFPALFEARRLRWPEFESLKDPAHFDQGISGYLQHVFMENFQLFPQLAQTWTGHAVPVLHRHSAAGEVLLDEKLLSQLDTLIVISFDSQLTQQVAMPAEIAAVRAFLEDSTHAVFVCPHHDIGYAEAVGGQELLDLQAKEHNHHGDSGVPAQQRFGGFALSLMAGLGLPIRNRFGLRPARETDGSASPVEVVSRDVFGILTGISALNLHPHLPHFERLGQSVQGLEVLVRQPIDMTASPHPFTSGGRKDFDAMLQATREAIPGCLVVADATLWNAVSGPRDTLEKLWRNVALGEW